RKRGLGLCAGGVRLAKFVPWRSHNGRNRSLQPCREALMEKITVAQARMPGSVGSKVRVQGWVRTRRDSKGGFSFVEVNDGSCFGSLQVVAPAALPNYDSEVKHLTAGCSVTVAGEIKASPAKGQLTEMHAEAVTLYGHADAEKYPLQPKHHSFEFL